MGRLPYFWRGKKGRSDLHTGNWGDDGYARKRHCKYLLCAKSRNCCFRWRNYGAGNLFKRSNWRCREKISCIQHWEAHKNYICRKSEWCWDVGRILSFLWNAFKRIGMSLWNIMWNQLSRLLNRTDPSYCRPSDRGGKCFDKCKINGDSAIPW